MLGPMDNPHAKIDERILVSQTSKPVSSACEPVPSHHGAEIAAGDKNKDSSSTTEEQQQQKASDVDIDLTHLPHNLRWLRLDPVSHPEEIQNATHAVDLWSGLDSSPDRERARSSFDFELDRSAVAPLAKCDDERNRLLAWPKFAFSEHDHRHHRQHHQRFRSSEPTNDIDRNFMLQLGDKPAFACPSHIHAHTSSDSSASGSSFASLSAYLHDFILQERQRQEEEMRVPSFASPSIAGSVSSEPNLPMRLSSLPISNKNMNSSNVFEDRRCLTPQYSASHLPPIPVNSMCGNGASAVRARQSANYSSAHGLLSFASSSPPALPTITSMPAQWPASPCGSSNIGGESIVQPLTGPPHSDAMSSVRRTQSAQDRSSDVLAALHGSYTSSYGNFSLANHSRKAQEEQQQLAPSSSDFSGAAAFAHAGAHVHTRSDGISKPARAPGSSLSIGSLTRSKSAPSSRRGLFEHHRSPPSPPPLDPMLNLYINNLPAHTTDESFYDLAASFGGNVVSHKAIIDPETGACKGYGFCMLETLEQANIAIEGFSRLGFHVSRAKQSFTARLRKCADKDSSNLYIHGLPLEYGENDVKTLLQPHVIISMRVLKSSDGTSKGSALVRLENREAAQRAVDALSGMEFPTGERLVVRFADSEAQRELKRNVLSATKQQVDISRLRDRTSSNINSISCSALSPQGGNTPVMSAGASETPTSDLLAADRRAPMQHPASQQQPLARNLLSSSHSAPLTPELAGQNTPTWQPFPLRINSSSADLSQTGLLAEGTKEPGSFFTARMLSSAGFTPRDLSATAAMSLTTAHGPLSAGLAAAARLAKLTSSMPAMPGANAPFHPHPSQLQLRNGMPMLRDAGFAENIQPNLRPSLEDERRNSSPAFSSVSPGVRSKTNSHQSLSGGSNTSTTAMSSGGANRSSSLASKCGGRGRVGAGHGSNNSRTQFQTARGPTATSLADGPVTPSKRDIRVQLG